MPRQTGLTGRLESRAQQWSTTARLPEAYWPSED